MLFWSFLFLLLVALLIAWVPVWPYSRRWRYTPTALAVLVLLGFMVPSYVGYIGYIGPWTQAAPPFDVEEAPDGAEEGVDAAPDAPQ